MLLFAGKLCRWASTFSGVTSWSRPLVRPVSWCLPASTAVVRWSRGQQPFAAQVRLLYNCGAATQSLLNGQSRIKLKVMRSTFALLPVNGERPRPLALSGSNSISFDSAAATQRLFRPHRGVLRRLMLNLGIKLCAQQNHDHGNPHPHHHADRRTQ